MDRRFIAEVHRLHEIGAFASFSEFIKTMDAMDALLSAIEKGRYHCNHKLLYNMLRNYPEADINWVLLGSAVFDRPEPTAPLPRHRGRPVRTQ